MNRLKFSKNVIQKTVHTILNATSDWQIFDVDLRKNQEIYTESQYPNNWSSSIVKNKLDKIVTIKMVTTEPPQMKNILKHLKVSAKMIFKRCLLFNTEETSLKLLQVD